MLTSLPAPFKSYADLLQHNFHFSDQKCSEKHRKEHKRNFDIHAREICSGDSHRHEILNRPRLATHFSDDPARFRCDISKRNREQAQPQPQPGNPSAAAHNPANKPQNAVSGLLANTGFNAFLGVIATLALVAAGLFILR